MYLPLKTREKYKRIAQGNGIKETHEKTTLTREPTTSFLLILLDQTEMMMNKKKR